MSLTLKDLQDIVAICEEGSFRKAAARLNISQPTLSARVAHMEMRLGAELFERSRGRSRATALATAIFDQAARYLDQLGGMMKQVEHLSNGTAGLVRLGLGPIPAYCMLEPLIGQVSELLPRSSLVIRSAGAQRLLGLLAEGEVDLAFCAGDPEFQLPEMRREVLLTQQPAIIVSPAHPLAGAARIGFRDVFAHPVALPMPDPKYAELIRKIVGVEPSALPGAVWFSNYGMIRRLVVSGRYATICTPFCFADDLGRGDLVQVPLEEPLVHEICLYSNSWSLPLPAVEKVAGLLRERSATLQRSIDQTAA